MKEQVVDGLGPKAQRTAGSIAVPLDASRSTARLAAVTRQRAQRLRSHDPQSRPLQPGLARAFFEFPIRLSE